MFSPIQKQGVLYDCLEKGWRVIPTGSCDHFDYQTGCKGHPIESTDKKENKMNDRYSFRGKQVDNGEWIIGNYLVYLGKPTIYQETMCDKNFIREKYWFCEVDPETIRQCTGLKDKNGVLVFEGDIIQICGNPPTIVFWNSSNASWAIISIGMYPKRNSGEVRSNGIPLCQDVEFGCKIIGNIWDNSELLK